MNKDKKIHIQGSKRQELVVESAHIGGTEQLVFGNYDRDLILRTKSRVRIQVQNKFYDLVTNQEGSGSKLVESGNSQNSNVIFTADIDNTNFNNNTVIIDTSTGRFYYYTENTLHALGGEFISYVNEQNLSETQQKLALKNLNLALDLVENSTNVYENQSIYGIEKGKHFIRRNETWQELYLHLLDGGIVKGNTTFSNRLGVQNTATLGIYPEPFEGFITNELESLNGFSFGSDLYNGLALYYNDYDVYLNSVGGKDLVVRVNDLDNYNYNDVLHITYDRVGLNTNPSLSYSLNVLGGVYTDNLHSTKTMILGADSLQPIPNRDYFYEPGVTAGIIDDEWVLATDKLVVKKPDSPFKIRSITGDTFINPPIVVKVLEESEDFDVDGSYAIEITNGENVEIGDLLLGTIYNWDSSIESYLYVTVKSIDIDPDTKQATFTGQVRGEFETHAYYELVRIGNTAADDINEYNSLIVDSNKNNIKVIGGIKTFNAIFDPNDFPEYTEDKDNFEELLFQKPNYKLSEKYATTIGYLGDISHPTLLGSDIYGIYSKSAYIEGGEATFDYFRLGDKLIWDGTNLIIDGAGTGGGGTSFLALSDTPNSYTNRNGNVVKVNPDGTGLRFDRLTSTDFHLADTQGILYWDGNQWIFKDYHSEVHPDTLALRTETGTVRGADAERSDDLVTLFQLKNLENKIYVDGGLNYLNSDRDTSTNYKITAKEIQTSSLILNALSNGDNDTILTINSVGRVFQQPFPKLDIKDSNGDIQFSLQGADELSFVGAGGTNIAFDPTTKTISIAGGSGGGGGGGNMLSSIYDPSNIRRNVYDRAFHTGTQSISTITSLSTELANRELISNKVFNLDNPDDTTYPTTKAVADYLSAGAYVTVDTDQDGLTGKKEWLGEHLFETAIAIPQAPPPVDSTVGKTFMFIGMGETATPPPTLSNLEDLQNVASTIPVNSFLYKGLDGVWRGEDSPVPDLSAYVTHTYLTSQNYLKAEDIDGLYITLATEQTGIIGNKEWAGRHHFDSAIAIPQTPPSTPVAGKAYMFIGAGSSVLPPPTLSNLEDLQNVADVIATNKYLYKNSLGQWVGADVTATGDQTLSFNNIDQLTISGGGGNTITLGTTSATNNSLVKRNASGVIAANGGNSTNWNLAYTNRVGALNYNQTTGVLTIANVGGSALASTTTPLTTTNVNNWNTAYNQRNDYLSAGFITESTNQTISGIKTYTNAEQTYTNTSLRQLDNLASFVGGATTPNNNYFMVYFNHTMAAVMWEAEIELYRYNSNAVVNDDKGTNITLVITGYNASAGSTLINKSVYQTAGGANQVISVTYFRQSNNNIVLGIRTPTYTNMYPKVYFKRLTLHHNITNAIANTIMTGANIQSTTATTGLTAVETILAANFNRQPNTSDALVPFKGKVTAAVIEADALIVPSSAPSSPESGKRYMWVV